MTNLSMYEYITERHYDNREVINYYNRPLRYRSFIRAVDRMAEYLNEIGVKKGDSVLLCLPNIPNVTIAFYAINKLGAVANIVHPLIPPGGLEKILREIPSKAAFVNDVFYRRYKRLLTGVSVILCSMGDYMPLYMRLPFKFGVGLTLIGVKAARFKSIVKRKREIAVKASGTGADPAVYLHSGGTTGEPKTVVLSNAACNGIAENINSLNGEDLETGTSMLMVLPVFHVFGLGVCMHSAMAAGGRAIMLPYFRAHSACCAIKRERVTFMAGVPLMYEKMLNDKAFKGDYLKDVRYCYCGGDKLKKETLDKFRAIAAEYGSSAELLEGYGLTEAGICTVNLKEKYKEGSVGVPIGKVKVAVMNEAGALLPPMETGQIAVGGNSVMSGYLGNNSRDVFAVIDGEKYVLTGDIGYLDEEGRLYFVDRKKRMIKISGINVYPSEIEREAEALCMVAHAAARPMSYSNGKPFIRLYAELKEGVDKHDAEIRIKLELQNRLIRYAAPREVKIIERMPITALGKIDYRALENLPE